MNKILICITGLIFTISASAAALKVGVVDIQQILKESSQVRQMQEQLKKQFDPLKQRVLALQNQLQDNLTKFNRNAAIMKDSEKKALQDTIAKQHADLQKQQIDFQRQLFAKQQSFQQEITAKIQAAAAKIAKKESYNLIEVKDGVVYSDPNMDITEKVLKAMQ